MLSNIKRFTFARPRAEREVKWKGNLDIIWGKFYFLKQCYHRFFLCHVLSTYNLFHRSSRPGSRAHSQMRGGSGVYFDPFRGSRTFLGSKSTLRSTSKRNLNSESMKSLKPLAQVCTCAVSDSSGGVLGVRGRKELPIVEDSKLLKFMCTHLTCTSM